MKTRPLLYICLLVVSSSLAQGNKMREKIKTQKIAFITDQLQLTSEEAQSFWPIFNAYETDVEAIKNGELRSVRKTLRSRTDLSDKEANDLLQRLLDSENDIHTLKVKLVSELKSVLPPQKILQLKIADEEFSKKLLERLREMRQKRSGRN